MSLDPAQRERLEISRGQAIARDHFQLGGADVVTDSLAFGVAVHRDDAVCVVASSDDLSTLGGLLVWLDRRRFTEVALVAGEHAPIHARRAKILAPEVVVWTLVDDAVRAVEPASVETPGLPPYDVAPFVAMIERCGAQAVVEEAILRAEVAGLEVGRVALGPEGPAFEVGVGRFDREAGVLLHAHRDIESALVSVVELVAANRNDQAAPHPLNRLCRERWMREIVRRTPIDFGLHDPELVEPIPGRANLLDPVPAALMARVEDTPVLVVCTVGVDLALVPAIADLVSRHHPAEVRIVVAARDRLAYLDRMAARLSCPVAFVDAPVPWGE